MSAPTIEAIAQTVEEVGKEHASSTGQGAKTDHNAQAAIGTWSSAWRHLRETMRSLFERINRLGQGLMAPYLRFFFASAALGEIWKRAVRQCLQARPRGHCLKRKDSTYRSGHSPDWVKMKNSAAFPADSKVA